MRSIAAAALACALAWGGAARAQIEQQPRPDDEQKPPAPPPPPTLQKPPELISSEQAVYPDEARAANKAGDVILRIIIDEEGNVARIDVIQSAGDDDAGHALDYSAMGAATNFLFAPATFCVVDPALGVDETG